MAGGYDRASLSTWPPAARYTLSTFSALWSGFHSPPVNVAWVNRRPFKNRSVDQEQDSTQSSCQPVRGMRNVYSASP